VRGNVKGATAAVMRYGYGRGEFFGGYEPRFTGRGVGPGRWMGSSDHISEARVGKAGKEANPMAGPGCKTPGPVLRSKPARWTNHEVGPRVAYGSATPNHPVFGPGEGRRDDAR
jgi:hypothetical protein